MPLSSEPETRLRTKTLFIRFTETAIGFYAFISSTPFTWNRFNRLYALSRYSSLECALSKLTVVRLADDLFFGLLQMEDEGNHGNDDTRCFILSTLAALQWSRVSCVLCRAPMLVFDRYPLVDGTFFLSPRQHSTACAEVIWNFSFNIDDNSCTLILLSFHCVKINI